MPKFSGEGRVGLLMEIAVIILDRLHVTAGYIIWPLFGLGALLIADWIWRGEWKEKHEKVAVRKRVWTYSSLSFIFLFAMAVWLVYGIKHLENSKPESGTQTAESIQPSVQTIQKPSPESHEPPTANKSKKKLEPQVQRNRGSNDTNTQIGTAQGPVAIAPNGIANAAPNFGTQSVYNAPPARHLTAEQKSVIASVIQGKPCKVAMMGALSNIEDAQAYALELRDAFKSAGCDVPEGVASLIAQKGTWYGIKVSYYDPGVHPDGEKVYTPPNTPQGLIIKALDDAHLGTVLIGVAPKDAIYLSVGGHPK